MEETLSLTAAETELSGSAASSAVEQASNVDTSSVLDAVTSLGNSVDGIGASLQAYQENVNTLLVGLASVQLFSLLATLLLFGAVLALVFVVALRRL